MKIFTVDLQVAAVLLGSARHDEIVVGLDLEIFSLVLVLEGRRRNNNKQDKPEQLLWYNNWFSLRPLFIGLIK